MPLYIPGAIVLYGATSYACKWLCGKHIHQLFFSGVDADKAFVDFIITECAGAISREVGQDTSAVIPKLRSLFEGETESSELAELLRVDYEIEKRSPTLCHLWIHILLKGGESGKRITVEHDVEWTWLPDLVREKFIRENPKKQAYIFISRSDADGSANPNLGDSADTQHDAGGR